MSKVDSSEEAEAVEVDSVAVEAGVAPVLAILPGAVVEGAVTTEDARDTATTTVESTLTTATEEVWLSLAVTAMRTRTGTAGDLTQTWEMLPVTKKTVSASKCLGRLNLPRLSGRLSAASVAASSA